MLTVILTGLGSGLAWPVNRHLNCFGVGGDLGWCRRHRYREREALT